MGEEIKLSTLFLYLLVMSGHYPTLNTNWIKVDKHEDLWEKTTEELQGDLNNLLNDIAFYKHQISEIKESIKEHRESYPLYEQTEAYKKQFNEIQCYLSTIEATQVRIQQIENKLTIK